MKPSRRAKISGLFPQLIAHTILWGSYDMGTRHPAQDSQRPLLRPLPLLPPQQLTLRQRMPKTSLPRSGAAGHGDESALLPFRTVCHASYVHHATSTLEKTKQNALLATPGAVDSFVG